MAMALNLSACVRHHHANSTKPILLICKRLNATSSFKARELLYNCTNIRKEKPKNVATIPFGSVFTDHMLTISWTKQSGWDCPVIEPVADLQIHPAAKVLHYSTTVFEGMKAFRGSDKKIRLFRPEMNSKRFLSSTERSGLPMFDGGELLKCLTKLIKIENDWVPKATPDVPCSLYIRPTHMGLDSTLGVSMPDSALLFILLSPVGPYYPTGLKPVSLLAEPAYVRSWPGGCGAFKMGANYAPTITLQQKAAEVGCQQCLWLLGDDEEVTEVGAMNLFLYWINENGEKELITAPLDAGTVLAGVTRDSLLDIAKQWGDFKVSERRYTMKMVVDALKENRVMEMFGAGTACVVAPVERIVYKKESLNIPTMDSGAPLTMKFYKNLLDIQYGRVEHKGWSQVVC